MGERTYWVGDVGIRFSEDDNTYGCLCTFPHNDGGELDVDRVRSLALLGAAVCLADGKEYMFLPDAVPEWIRSEIDRVLRKDICQK